MSDSVPSILIVDDVPGNVMMLGEMLADEYRLHVARNGPDALALAEEHRPDLILLDVMMPGMDGFEVFRRLRMIESLAEVPVIFVTALDEATDESRGLELGAADYITKPFNEQLVRLRVKNHLELKRHRDLLVEQRDQLTQKNNELTVALSRVKRLEGIISICMYCKKIRTEQQSWEQLEMYLTEHSDAMFSHGMCPDCLEKYYPEIPERKRQKASRETTEVK